jgi:hypothetical protein
MRTAALYTIRKGSSHSVANLKSTRVGSKLLPSCPSSLIGNPHQSRKLGTKCGPTNPVNFTFSADQKERGGQKYALPVRGFFATARAGNRRFGPFRSNQRCNI